MLDIIVTVLIIRDDMVMLKIVIKQYDGKRKRDSRNNAIKMMTVLRIDITVYYNRYHGNAIDDVVVVVVDDDNNYHHQRVGGGAVGGRRR
jgi:hypothetical protein